MAIGGGIGIVYAMMQATDPAEALLDALLVLTALSVGSAFLGIRLAGLMGRLEGSGGSPGN